MATTIDFEHQINLIDFMVSAVLGDAEPDYKRMLDCLREIRLVIHEPQTRERDDACPIRHYPNLAED